VVVAGAANQGLLSTGIADEFDPEIIRRARGPDTNEVSAEIVDAKRWVPFIGVQQSERLREPLLICCGTP